MLLGRHVAGAEGAVAAGTNVVRNHDLHLLAIAALHAFDEVPLPRNKLLTLGLEGRSRDELSRLATTEQLVRRIAVTACQHSVDSFVRSHARREQRSRI